MHSNLRSSSAETETKFTVVVCGFDSDKMAHPCPSPMKPTSNGAFQGDDPLHFALPLAILQIVLVLIVTRGLAFLLKPLRQPRVIAEIIVSFLLSLIKFGKEKNSLNDKWY